MVMKQVDTEPGSQYSVDSAAGCTVSTPAGQVICRVMPGILGSFQASGYVTCFSDDAAGVQLVSSGTPGGTGGQQLTISQALDAASRSEAAARKAAADAARAESAQAEAEDARDDAEEAAARVEELKRVTLEGAAGAALDAERAVAAKDEAVLAMGDAEKAKADAEAAKMDAQTAESNAKASETQAAADKAAAEQAKTDAQASQSKAEEQAAIATAAAEAAQAAESIAAQAARPATMFVLKDGLGRLLGNPDAVDIDTDGQKIIVHTDRLEGDILEQAEDLISRYVPAFIEVERYNHTIEISWRQVVASEECTTLNEVFEIMPELSTVDSMALTLPKYKTRISTDCGGKIKNQNLHLEITLPHSSFDGYVVKGAIIGSAVLNLPNATEVYVVCKQNTIINSITVNAPKATRTSGTFRQDGWPYQQNREIELTLNVPEALILNNEFNQLGNAGLMTLYAPKCTSIVFLFKLGRDGKYPPNPRMNLTLGKVENAEEAFTNCYGIPDSDFPTDWQYLKYGNKMFTDCQLGRDVTVAILNSLQAATAETGTNIWCITMGIHIDHQTDDEVLEAIANAESKGWILTVQWNGTPTAQASVTYGLRTPPIYARVSEHELPDGTTERVLDWGHYVTDPSGYEEFRSVEAAREHFGLPDEPLTETE